MKAIAPDSRKARYHGLHMTADEYFRLKDDGCLYELIDGVVCVSPSPTTTHQEILTELVIEIGNHLRLTKAGKVLVEIDVHLGQTPAGKDLVYCPDLVFLRSERAAECRERITGPPDAIVEIISPDSRQHDSVRKKADYERCGVSEYWIIDPERNALTFFRLESGRYVAIHPVEERFASTAVPGFCLDLTHLRSIMRP